MTQLGQVICTYNPSTWEAELKASLGLKKCQQNNQLGNIKIMLCLKEYEVFETISFIRLTMG
jgi:hypothetical protein